MASTAVSICRRSCPCSHQYGTSLSDHVWGTVFNYPTHHTSPQQLSTDDWQELGLVVVASSLPILAPNHVWHMVGMYLLLLEYQINKSNLNGSYQLDQWVTSIAERRSDLLKVPQQVTISAAVESSSLGFYCALPPGQHSWETGTKSRRFQFYEWVRAWNNPTSPPSSGCSSVAPTREVKPLTPSWCPHHCYMALYHSSDCSTLNLCSPAFPPKLWVP